MNDTAIYEIIKSVAAHYFLSEHIESLPLRRIVLSESLIEDIKKLQPELLAHPAINIEQIKSCSGYTLLYPDNTATVLILKEGSMENTMWIETLTHELTHVKDYADFFPLMNCCNYYDMLNHIPFWYWTEFHAKYKGFQYMLSYAQKLPKQYLQRYFDSLSVTEIVAQIESDIDYRNKAYYIMHFIGELLAYEKYDLVGESLRKKYDVVFLRFPWLYEVKKTLSNYTESITIDEMLFLESQITRVLR